MRLHATLEAIGSERDINGNTYWAMRYIDHETGKQAEGTVSGGESNIAQVCCNDTGGWDGGIRNTVLILPKRKFRAMTRDWRYAGCTREQLLAFIKDNLK
jgi:hypothetical protein